VVAEAVKPILLVNQAVQAVVEMVTKEIQEIQPVKVFKVNDQAIQVITDLAATVLQVNLVPFSEAVAEALAETLQVLQAVRLNHIQFQVHL
tara:strand:- start:465 stop:737 length:273 start_codon:yes stop_codon:yes gene_type:complete